MGLTFSSPDFFHLWPLIQLDVWGDDSKRELLSLHTQYGKRLHQSSDAKFTSPLHMAMHVHNIEAVEFLVEKCDAFVDGPMVCNRDVKEMCYAKALYSVHGVCVLLCRGPPLSLSLRSFLTLK